MFFTGYAIVSYAKNGFDDLMVATWFALVFSGAGWVYKKKNKNIFH